MDKRHVISEKFVHACVCIFLVHSGVAVFPFIYVSLKLSDLTIIVVQLLSISFNDPSFSPPLDCRTTTSLTLFAGISLRVLPTASSALSLSLIEY